MSNKICSIQTIETWKNYSSHQNRIKEVADLYVLASRDWNDWKAFVFNTAAIPLGWLRNSLMWYLLPPRSSLYVGRIILSFFAANKFAFFLSFEFMEVNAFTLRSIFLNISIHGKKKLTILSKDLNSQYLSSTTNPTKKKTKIRTNYSDTPVIS